MQPKGVDNSKRIEEGGMSFEDRLILLSKRFAEETKNDYLLEIYSPGGRVISIAIGELDNGGMMRGFKHRIGFKREEIDDTSNYTKTLNVSDSPLIRRLYIEFIDYMKSQGIPLINHFEATWENDPHRYPIAEKGK